MNIAGNRAYDVLSGNLTVTTNEGSPVAMVLGTDYELDSEMGRIFILSTSTVAATSISGGKGLRVTLTARVGAKAVNQVRGLTQSVVEGALKFIADSPISGKKQEYVLHRVKLRANGDLSLIGDDWSQMPFEGTAESNPAADANSPFVTIRTVA